MDSNDTVMWRTRRRSRRVRHRRMTMLTYQRVDSTGQGRHRLRHLLQRRAHVGERCRIAGRGEEDHGGGDLLGGPSRPSGHQRLRARNPRPPRRMAQRRPLLRPRPSESDARRRRARELSCSSRPSARTARPERSRTKPANCPGRHSGPLVYGCDECWVGVVARLPSGGVSAGRLHQSCFGISSAFASARRSRWSDEQCAHQSG